MNFKDILDKPLPSQEKTECGVTDTPVVPNIPPIIGGPTTEVDVVELDPAEEQRVDATINAVATPIIVGDELSETEFREFVESTDFDESVAEGFLTEKTIVKFDKEAKRAQLFEIAVAAVASEKKDPLYKKLLTLYEMERVIKKKLRQKYRSEALKRVKVYLDKAKKSKSNVIKRAINKITGR